MTKLRKCIIAGLMLACTIVLNRFISIKTPILVISFSGLPIMLCGILLGPIWTMFVACLADLIGALLFPFGAYFVGYTISSALAGLIYGLFLYRKYNSKRKIFIFKLIISTFLVLTICNGVLNTLWIYITTKKAVFAILPTRIIKQLIMLPILTISIYFINLGLEKAGIYKKLFCEDYEEENLEMVKEEANNKQIATEKVAEKEELISNDAESNAIKKAKNFGSGIAKENKPDKTLSKIEKSAKVSKESKDDRTKRD